MSRHEQKKVHNMLDDELSGYTFKSHKSVTARTHPKSFQEKLARLWNKEVDIPLVPVGAALFIVLTAGSFVTLSDQEAEIQRQLIERGGSYYWSDMLDREDDSS